MRAERLLCVACVLAVCGCAVSTEKAGEAAAEPPVEAAPVVLEPVSAAAADELVMRAMLAYYRKSRGMSRAELARERAAIKGRTEAPMEAVRLAILLGHEPSELARALGLLERIARSGTPQAVSLQPLVRLLADQYAERLKLETQVDRLGAGQREAERRASALQDKLDALAEIERSLPGRPAPALPAIEEAR